MKLELEYILLLIIILLLGYIFFRRADRDQELKIMKANLGAFKQFTEEQNHQIKWLITNYAPDDIKYLYFGTTDTAGVKDDKD